MICKGCLDNQQLRSNPGLKLANAFGVLFQPLGLISQHLGRFYSELR